MVAGFGKVWYDEGAIANIFSIQDLKKQHHITYDSEEEDAFIVHKDETEPVKFKCTSQGIMKINWIWLRVIQWIQSRKTVKVIPKFNLIEQSRLGVYIMSLGHPSWKITRDL